MEVLRAIKERRSVRKFKRKQVNHELVITILDMARWAPSAGNLQPWEFIIVEDKSVQESLVSAALNQDYITDAPVMVVVCADTERSALRFGMRGKHLYSLAETAASVQNMLIAAHALGLGTCWVGAFHEDAVRNILGLPESVVPIGIIPIGWPDEQPKAPPRVDLSHMVHHDRYGHMEPVKGTGRYDVHRVVEEDMRKDILNEERSKEAAVDIDRDLDIEPPPKRKKRRKKGNPLLRLFG